MIRDAYMVLVFRLKKLILAADTNEDTAPVFSFDTIQKDLSVTCDTLRLDYRLSFYLMNYFIIMNASTKVDLACYFNLFFNISFELIYLSILGWLNYFL